MREIKFRGMTTNLVENEFVYGYYQKLIGYGKYDAENVYNLIVNENDESNYVDEKTVGQFTGLKDKNGVEIYDGDVVESDAGLSGTIKFLPEHCAFLVYFKNENENCYEYLNCELTIKYTKVIGNIHEVTP